MMMSAAADQKDRNSSLVAALAEAETGIALFRQSIAIMHKTMHSAGHDLLEEMDAALERLKEAA